MTGAAPSIPPNLGDKIIKTTGWAAASKLGLDAVKSHSDKHRSNIQKRGTDRELLDQRASKVRKMEVETGGKSSAVEAAMDTQMIDIVRLHTQTALERQETPYNILQDLKMTKAFPRRAVKANLYVFKDRAIPIDLIEPKEVSYILEFVDVKGNVMRRNTVSTATASMEKSKATDTKSLNVYEGQGSKGQGSSSSFASISDNLPKPKSMVTVTSLDIESGYIVEKNLSGEETRTFHAVEPKEGFNVAVTPPSELGGAALVLLAGTFFYVVGFPVLVFCRRKIDALFSLEKEKGNQDPSQYKTFSERTKTISPKEPGEND